MKLENKLQRISESDDMKRLRKLTVEYEQLKWKMMGEIENVCPYYGVDGESLDDWESRLDKFMVFIDQQDVLCKEGKEFYRNNPIEFHRNQCRANKRLIKSLRESE